MTAQKYENGEVIVRQGEVGDCMYVIEAGKVEVVLEQGGAEIRVAVLGSGDFFGEMALLEGEPRAATVRALGNAYVRTVERRDFFGRIHEDGAFAIRLIKKLSDRTRQLETKLAQLADTAMREAGLMLKQHTSANRQ